MLTQPDLKKLFDYDPLTGLFTNKTVRGHGRVKIGEVAGSIYANGYRYIEINGKAYRSCRLVWLYVYGEFPATFVEHRNGQKSDDRLENLRLATNGENQANRGTPSNNTSGTKGVRFETDRWRWRAQIMINGKSKNLGRFKTRDEAMVAYEKAAKEAWGDYAKTEGAM